MLRARLDISVWFVQTASYASLSIERQVRPHWIISHVQRGEVRTETGGERFPVREGEIMLHPPNLPFSEFAAGPGTHQWLAFDALTIDDAPLDLFLRYPLPPVLSLGRCRPAWETAFQQLEAVAGRESGQDQHSLALAGWASLLFAETLSAWEAAGCPLRPRSQLPPSGRFAELLIYMENHLADRITRDDLADRAALHPGSFHRAFRAAYGAPPLKILMEMRLSRARTLLETGDATLDAIARACGLGDAARLGRLFRVRYGVPPGVHRQQSRSARASYLTVEEAWTRQTDKNA